MKTAGGEHQLLNASEWNFQKIPQRELETAWEWELERSLGSGAKPWLDLCAPDRDTIIALTITKSLSLVTEYGLERAHPDFVHLFNTLYNEIPATLGKPPSHQKLHLLHVNWSGSKTKVLSELLAWFEQYWSSVSNADRELDKGGRKKQFAAWLTDLAIYRAKEVGLSRSEAIKRFKPLLSGVSSTAAGKLSSSHWADAQKRTRDRIARRHIDLSVKAVVGKKQRDEKGNFASGELTAEDHANARYWEEFFTINRLPINLRGGLTEKT